MVNVRRLSQAGRKRITSLQRKRVRDESGLCVVEGRRAVEAAVVSGAAVEEIIVTEDLLADSLIETLLGSAELVLTAPEKDFERMSGVATSQGILAVVRTAWEPLENLSSSGRIVVLDRVQDPGNVGTIIRCASWFGIDAVVCGPGVADCFGPKVLRASMGGVWDLKIARSSSLVADVLSVRSMGFEVYAADLEGEEVDAWSAPPPSCLVFGNEAHGVSEEVLGFVRGRVRIPRGKGGRATESLNVAVAGGILMFWWTRQAR